MLVEAAGLLGFGMGQQAAAADGLAEAGLAEAGLAEAGLAEAGLPEAGDPGDDIQQQGRTEALTFMALVHPQAGQQSHELGVAAGATAQPLGQISDRDARHAPGVISNDVGLIHLGDHKHPGGAGAMGLLGHVHQPGGLLHGAAAKACELVTARQQLWRLVAAHAWG